MKNTKEKSIFFVVNVDWFFLSHRLPIAIAAQKIGYQVTVVAGDTGRGREIENYGFKFIELPLHRGKTTLLNELIALFFLIKIYLSNKPTIIHQVGLKLIIFGSIAFRISFSKSKLINALSGAGTLFSHSTKLSLSFNFILKLFDLFSLRSTHYIFQNNDDFQLFKRISNKVIKYTIIKGSGVDLEQFKHNEQILKHPKILLFVGRLLKEKGIIELIEAAKLLKNSYFGKIKFVIVGNQDPHNPSSISDDLIKTNQIDGYLDWKGYIKDVRPYLIDSYLIILPSYREGLPKSLIEACGIGRAIITTNAIGCKEVVDDGINGYLVEVRNANDLSIKIEKLILDEELTKKMGLESRKKAEKEFDILKVVESTLTIYKS